MSSLSRSCMTTPAALQAILLHIFKCEKTRKFSHQQYIIMLQVISFLVHFINLFFLCFKFISIHFIYYRTQKQGKTKIECFHMMSRRPYWCPKTMKRWPCWCPKPVLWELNSFLMQMLSFVPINLHRCWSRE